MHPSGIIISGGEASNVRPTRRARVRLDGEKALNTFATTIARLLLLIAMTSVRRSHHVKTKNYTKNETMRRTKRLTN